MPAYCTHYIFACEMLHTIAENTAISVNRDAVLLGTQGPDIFFFHRAAPWMPGKSLRKTGSALHRAKPGEILDAMAVYCKHESRQRDIALSYAYGFILHYALDRNCHPFVYAKQKELKEKGSTLHNGSLHNIIEMSMDSVLLNQKLGVENPSCFNTAATVPDNTNVLREVSCMLSYCIQIILNKTVTEQNIVQALEDTKAVQKLLHDESGKKTAVIKSIETLAAPLTGNFRITSMLRPRDLENAKKYGNISREPWHSPYADGIRRESFLDLYSQAKEDAKEMICAFNRMLDGIGNGTQITNNLSFLTGVEVK